MTDESSEDSSRTSRPQADGAPQPTADETAATGVVGASPSASLGRVPALSAPAPANATAFSGRRSLGPEVAHVRSELESQIRAKPGRALLIALGVGYVVGRIFHGKRDG